MVLLRHLHLGIIVHVLLKSGRLTGRHLWEAVVIDPGVIVSFLVIYQSDFYPLNWGVESLH